MEKVSCKIARVHKIAPARYGDDNLPKPVDLPASCFSDTKALGKALREAGVMSPGQRVTSFRAVGDKVVAFPSKSTWHSIAIELPAKG